MFDPEQTARSLTDEQKRRLQAIAQAEKALPWEDVDDGLEVMELVGQYTGIFDERLATMGRYGWQVLQAMARQ